MNIQTDYIHYQDEAQNCIAYMAWDGALQTPRPGILINHAWGGRDEFAENKAMQMAASGYVGFAVDNYGEGKRLESVEDKQVHMMALKNDRAALRKRLMAGLNAARGQPQIDPQNMASMGFCFGGLCALDLARAGADIKAAISFHGLLDAPNLPPQTIRAKILIAHGWDDPMAPPQHLVDIGTELTAAQCDWQVQAFGRTTHAFMVAGTDSGDGVLKYNPVSEVRAWQATLSLLKEVF